MVIKEIQDQILIYFKDTTKDRLNSRGNYWSFKVLDNKYKYFYTGVSIQYICYDLFKAKYRKSDVAQAIYNLVINDEIKTLYCPHVKKHVFCNKECVYTNIYTESYDKKEAQIKHLESFIIK